MDSTYIFTDRAQEYACYRPSYPHGAIASVLEGLASPSQLVAADIGAGTGIASRLLGDHCDRYYQISNTIRVQVQYETSCS